MIMKAKDQYFKVINEYLERIHEEEAENIDKAAGLVAGTIAKDRVLFALGPGCHSRIGVEDIFFRAGGLAPVNAMLEYSMDVGALKTTNMERVPQTAVALLDYYKVGKDDVLILINAYGINGASVEAAMECQKRGVHVIGVTSPNNSKAIPKDHPARHPSKQDLCDIPMDVLIDCKMPVGDAIVKIDGLEPKIGPMTTIAISFIMQSITVAAIEKLVEKGIEPPILTSLNAPDRGVNNAKLLEKYYGRIKNL